MTTDFMYWLRPFTEGMLFGMAAMAVHECGHLVAAKLLGVEVKKVAIQWHGICTVREAGPPLKNLLISIAGPLVNVGFVLTWAWSPSFCLANMCFAVVNVLPIERSDGSRALACCMQLRELSRARQGETSRARSSVHEVTR